MRNITFKKAVAKNFLPFGPDGFEIDFSTFKNIVLIKGENKDAKIVEDSSSFETEESRISSNGAGKSSVQEIIVYGLYGKTIKRPEKLKNNIIHNLVNRDCLIELYFNEYKILRTRKENGNPQNNSLRLWKSDKGVWDASTEITQGTMAATQKAIEDAVGLTYDAFINVAIFTDDQRSCFLESDGPTKRDIVENLLSLTEYKQWHENTKALLKEINAQITSKTKEYELLLSNKDDAQKRLTLAEGKYENWKTTKSNEIATLEKLIVSKGEELVKTDNGAAIIAYQNAQSKIEEISNKLPILEESRLEFAKNLKVAKQKEEEQKNDAQNLTNQYNEINYEIKSKLADRKKKEQEVLDLEANVPGTNCDKCRGVIEKQNLETYANKIKLDINEINLNIKTQLDVAKEIKVKVDQLKENQKKVSVIVSKVEDKISEVDRQIKSLQKEMTECSKIREPKADNSELLLEQERVNLRSSLESKKNELNSRSPFQDIIENDEETLKKISENVEVKTKEIKDLEAEVPYYSYWLSGFGETGIRKWVIDGIIPELNNKINYWLQFLIDNKITFNFDNELNETIERNPVDGDPYVYHAMSAGQRRRLNLAVSQSFAHIMALSAGSIPSVVFLDEVSTNVDPLGVQGVYNMILELAETKQVFVTTHSQDLLRMLEGSDVINLVHEKGFTKLVS